LYQVRE